MTKIALYFPGNALHSFLIEDRWQRMYDEQLGLHALGRSGIPVTTSHQGMDFKLYPFLRDVLAQYPNISVANAPYGHPLLPLVDKGHQKWETREQIGNVPITFFSEFSTPEEHLIPTEFFFHLSSQTTQYSLRFGVVVKDPELGTPFPAHAISVKYGKRIGIVLDGFEKFNKAWFAFGAVPTEANLDAVMKEIEALANGPRPYCVIPIDLEQPWVGSTLGAKMFDLFFGALKARGLDQHIVPITEVLEAARSNPMSIPKPHRIFTKWTTHQVQLDYLIHKISKIEPKTADEHMLYALAASSDLLSSWNRYVQRSNKDKPNVLACKTIDGVDLAMSQGHNEALQEMCLEACNRLMHGQESFADRVSNLSVHTGLTRRIYEIASQT